MSPDAIGMASLWLASHPLNMPKTDAGEASDAFCTLITPPRFLPDDLSTSNHRQPRSASQGATIAATVKNVGFLKLKYAFCYYLTHRQAVIKTIIAIRKFP